MEGPFETICLWKWLSSDRFLIAKGRSNSNAKGCFAAGLTEFFRERFGLGNHRYIAKIP